MRIWLDDCRPMPPTFDVHCFTVEEALLYVLDKRATHISFDNDLGEGIPEGYDLAKIIEELAFDGAIPRLTWFVHSANPQGQKNIRAAMEQADIFWDKDAK